MPDERNVSMEMRAPQPFANHGHLPMPRPVLIRREKAPCDRRDSERGKIARGRDFTLNSLRSISCSQVEARATRCAQTCEGVALSLRIGEISHRKAAQHISPMFP